MSWVRVAAVAGLGVLFAVACGKETPTVPNPGGPPLLPMFRVGFASDAMTVSPGEGMLYFDECPYIRMLKVSYEVQRYGYAGGITLSAVAQSPLDVSAFYPEPGKLVGTLCFWTPASTAYGDYAIVLRAKAMNGDRPDAVDTLTVHVWPSPEIRPPNSITVNRGGTNTATLALDASVTVTTSGAPPGVTIVRNGGYLDVSAAPGATLGAATIKVKLAVLNWSDSTNIQLKVQDAPPKRAITFRPCYFNQILTPLTNPSYGIASEGEPWTAITPDADGAFRATVTERVSFYQRSYFMGGYSFGPTLRVIHATASELETTTCPATLSGPRSVTVAVASAKDRVVTLGPARSSTSGAGNLTVSQFPAGAQDLVAAGHGADGSRVALVQRAIDPAQGATISLDFADASARLDSATTVLSGPGTVRLHTSNTIAPLGYTDSTHVSGRYWALPLSRLQPADVQSLYVTTSASGFQGIVQYFREPIALTGNFGPALAAPSVDSSARVIRVASQPEYPDIAGVGRRIPIDWRGVYDNLEVWQTKGYAGGTPATWTFAAPDLGRLLAMPRILGEYYSAGAVSGDFAAFFGGSPTAGSQLKWALTRPPGVISQAAGGSTSGAFGVWLAFPSRR